MIQDIEPKYNYKIEDFDSTSKYTIQRMGVYVILKGVALSPFEIWYLSPLVNEFCIRLINKITMPTNRKIWRHSFKISIETENSLDTAWSTKTTLIWEKWIEFWMDLVRFLVLFTGMLVSLQLSCIILFASL